MTPNTTEKRELHGYTEAFAAGVHRRGLTRNLSPQERAERGLARGACVRLCVDAIVSGSCSNERNIIKE